jgi:hypothetical protein
MSTNDEKPAWADKREHSEEGKELGLTLDIKDMGRLLWVTDDTGPEPHGLHLEIMHFDGPGSRFPVTLLAVVSDVEYENANYDPSDPRNDDDGEMMTREVNLRPFEFTDPDAARTFAENILIAADELERIQAENARRKPPSA